MPVQTRSQSQSQINNIASLQQGVKPHVKPHVKQEQISLLQWFIIYNKKSIDAFKRLMREFTYIKETKMSSRNLYGNNEKKWPSHTKFLQEQSKDKLKQIYFDQLRILIELYYNCEQYIDQVFQEAITLNKKETYLNLILTFYKKSAEIQYEIFTSNCKPRTEEERSILKTALLQFFATDAVLKKYLTKQQQYYKVKRLTRQLK
jgi:hypothetical protein